MYLAPWQGNYRDENDMRENICAAKQGRERMRITEINNVFNSRGRSTDGTVLDKTICPTSDLLEKQNASNRCIIRTMEIAGNITTNQDGYATYFDPRVAVKHSLKVTQAMQVKNIAGTDCEFSKIPCGIYSRETPLIKILTRS